jgi:four helix bundle protein
MEPAKNTRAIRSYRDLRIWQMGMDLVIQTYDLAKKLPKFEQYALASQLRRAAVSVPSNIAEGHGRLGRRGYLYHVSVAASSLRELETQFIIAERLEYATAEEVSLNLVSSGDLLRMCAGLTQKLKVRARTPNP